MAVYVLWLLLPVVWQLSTCHNMSSCEIIIPLASLSLTEFAAALVITCVCMRLGTASPFGASWDTPPCSKTLDIPSSSLSLPLVVM